MMRTPQDGDTHLLTTLDSTQGLAQRPLQVTDPDLSHAVTLAAMWSSDRGSCNHTVTLLPRSAVCDPFGFGRMAASHGRLV